MKQLFFAFVVAALLAGCTTTPDSSTSTKTGYSADFPSVPIQDGRAMPAYTPYWK